MTAIYKPLILPEFSTLLASEFRDALDASCYLTIGKQSAWAGTESASNFTPPMPINNDNYKHQFLNDIIGYIRIAKENTRLVIDRKDFDGPQENSKSYRVGDIIVTNSLPQNSSVDSFDGWMVYRCVECPILTGTCSAPINIDMSSCDLAGETWRPSDCSTFPTGVGAGITIPCIDAPPVPLTVNENYVWEYLYTIPLNEIADFCTPEYIVVPSESELANDLVYWRREMVSTTVFDKGRVCYSIKATKLMLKTIISDNYFRNMLATETSYRQIGVIYKPFVYALAPGDTDGSPWFGDEGSYTLMGWKIIANPATSVEYDAYEMLIESGEILYIENRAPVIRNYNETNDIRIILGF